MNGMLGILVKLVRTTNQLSTIHLSHGIYRVGLTKIIKKLILHLPSKKFNKFFSTSANNIG